MSRDTDDIVLAAVIAHDLGAPLLKVPVPDVAGRAARVDAVARVVASRGRAGALPRAAPTAGWRRPASLDEIGTSWPAAAPGWPWAGPSSRSRRRGHGQAGGRDRARPVILTVDLGTSVTKAALWDRDGLVALAGAPVDTVHPAPGWAEQDPSAWWASVVGACAEVRAGAPRPVRLGRGGRMHRRPPDLRLRRRRPASPRPGHRVVGPPGRRRGGGAGRSGASATGPPLHSPGIPVDAGVGGGQAGLAGRPPATAARRQRLDPDPAGPGGVAAHRRRWPPT